MDGPCFKRWVDGPLWTNRVGHRPVCLASPIMPNRIREVMAKAQLVHIHGAPGLVTNWTEKQNNLCEGAGGGET